MNILSMSLVFLAGLSIPLAVTLNTMLGRELRSPLGSGLAVMLTGTLFMLLVMLGTRAPFPHLEALARPRLWFWGGGILITLYMLTLIYHSPKLGIGLTTSLVVAGQLVMGLVIDHFGAFGMPQTTFSVWRFGGMLLILAGVTVLKIF